MVPGLAEQPSATPSGSSVLTSKIQLNIDWSKVNLDEIELPEDDDLGIKSDDGEDELGQLEQESGFGNVIVVDNLPVVPPEKFEKLQTVVKKIFGQIGNIRENGLWMPVDDETKKTRGFVFVEYSTPQEAQAAKEQTDGYKLDKSHVFKVNMFDDFDRYMKVPEVYEEPPAKPYTPPENYLWYLMDERGRDQFVIRFVAETEIYWNDPRQGKPEPIYQRTFWTESFVQWSPLGTFLATMHRQGAAVWVGPSWQRIQRFAHPQVRLIDFSPGEKFLVTYSSHEPTSPEDSQKIVLNVFDVRSGASLREFKGNADDFLSGGATGGSAGGGGAVGLQWPFFKWAGGLEDKYFARLGKNAISVYETASMSLLDKKSVRVDNVTDFCWSPAEPVLAFFVPESGGGNIPAKISVMQIPSRNELRQKNLFSVSECRLVWQSAGDYLAVQVERYTKTKKSSYAGFEFFRMRERDIPIEVLELENKNEKIIDFSWEPKGHRFAIVHGDGARPDVTFYSMKGPASSSSSSSSLPNKITKLHTLKAKQVNSVVWSPIGRFAVLAGLKGLNGQLEFFNVDEMETMGAGEHFMATDVEWDPTGRYVATSVTSVHQLENGFHVWSLSGRLLYKVSKDRFQQFLWRPRPPSLLPPEKDQEISKNLRKYSKKYEVEDEEAGHALNAAEMERRRKIVEEWRARLASWKRIDEEEKPLKVKLWVDENGRSTFPEEIEGGEKEEEVEVEETISVQEEVMSFDSSMPAS